MSYVIAPTFEGNRIGIRRLGVLSGIGGVPSGLGDMLSDQYAADLANAGLDQGTIDILVSKGATNSDFAALLAGATDVPTLMYRLTGPAPVPNPITGGVINPAVAPVPPPTFVQTALTTQPTSPNPANAPQSPPGSRLLYTVTYKYSISPISAPAPDGLIASIGSALGTHRMSVLSSTLVSNTYLGLGSATIQFTISDTVGHQFLSEAQSVLDSLVQKFTYNSKTGSQITMVAVGGSSSAGTTQPTSLTTWFEQNAAIIGLGVAGVVVLGMILRRR